MRKKDRPRALGSRLALRDMRLRAGLTQQQLAARLGVTCHAIQAWERGERAVRKGWDFKVAEALGCSVAELRQDERVARSKRWRQALVNLSDISSSAMGARNSLPAPNRRRPPSLGVPPRRKAF
jgi:transcriptional regulator with XRE-family HTH domain